MTCMDRVPQFCSAKRAYGAPRCRPPLSSHILMRHLSYSFPPKSTYVSSNVQAERTKSVGATALLSARRRAATGTLTPW